MPKRDDKGRFTEESGFFDDVTDLSLPELFKLNKYFTRKTKSENKAARGTGGVGLTKFDEKAREWSKKQLKVSGEILDRLTDIHLGRSKEAQASDEGKSAKLTLNPIQWAREPGRFDYPGVDTKREETTTSSSDSPWWRD